MGLFDKIRNEFIDIIEWVDPSTDNNRARSLQSLEEGALPPAAEVRVEEFVNYFRYKFAAPAPHAKRHGSAADAARSDAQRLRAHAEPAPDDEQHEPLEPDSAPHGISARSAAGSDGHAL